MFKLDGARLHGDAEVAPRGMDSLDVEIREEAAGDGKKLSVVVVDFVDFRTGIKEKISTT
jgi:hypothetical protein